MICRECGSPMVLDSCYRWSDVSRDEFHVCPDCKTTCLSEIRFKRVYKEIWDFRNGEFFSTLFGSHQLDRSIER